MIYWICDIICSNAWALGISCLLFLLSKLYFRTRFVEINKNLKENTTQEEYFQKCQSPSCVRCRSSREILQRARTRLSYQAFSDNTEDDRINSKLYKLHFDLENSFNKRHRHVDGLDQKPAVFKMSGLEAKPWWNIDEGEDLIELSLRDEVLSDIKSEFFELMSKYDKDSAAQSLWKINTTPNGMWSICHLMDQGRATKAVELCPKTWEAVQKIHGLMKNNLFGNVAFSVILPGTTISKHYGPTNIRLRCHIGLLIPLNCCSMFVNEEEKQFDNGQVLLFDDSFSHSVEHKGSREDGMRAVLIIDVWHPEIDDELRQVFNYIFSSGL